MSDAAPAAAVVRADDDAVDQSRLLGHDQRIRRAVGGVVDAASLVGHQEAGRRDDAAEALLAGAVRPAGSGVEPEMPT